MIQLKNFMEEVVFSLIPDVIEDMPICKCDKCKMDIAAIALNILPSKYVVTEQGQLYSKVDTLKTQFEVDVVSAITKAAVIVSKNPQH
jgi:competence protein ComFB